MQSLNSFDAEWRLLVAATRNVDGRHFAGRLQPVGDNLQRIRPAISPPAATSGVFEDGWRRVHPGKKRWCAFGSRQSSKLGEGI
jgi:hypothetical protein